MGQGISCYTIVSGVCSQARLVILGFSKTSSDSRKVLGVQQPSVASCVRVRFGQMYAKGRKGKRKVQYSEPQVLVGPGTVKSPTGDNISDYCKDYSQHLLRPYCRSGVNTIKGIFNF